MSVELLHTDCMTYMKTVPDKFFELAIVDPPYGININMNMGRKKGKKRSHEDKDWDDSIPSPDYFIELARVSKNQIIWGGNYFPLPITRGWIFWDKCVPQGVDFSDGELAWTSFDRTLLKVTVPYSGFVGTEGKIHPTQKPVKLYKRILKEFALAGDKILDTHLGSGSIAIACYDMGLDFVGCEIDKDYFSAAAKRYEQVKSQLKLFNHEGLNS